MTNYTYPPSEKDAPVITYAPDSSFWNSKTLEPGPGIAITIIGSQVIVENTGGGGSSTLTYLTQIDETATAPNSFRALAGANMVINFDNLAHTATFSSTASGGGSGPETYLTVNHEATLANSRQILLGNNLFPTDAGPFTTYTIQSSKVTTDTAGSYNLTATSNTIRLGDASTGTITYNLPAVAGVAEKFFTIKKIDGSANTITISPNGAETIDGQNSPITLTIPYISYNLTATSSGWWIL